MSSVPDGELNMSIYVDVKTKTGVFRVRKPMGRIGAIHFGIITKYMSGGSDGEAMSPAQREALGDGFIEWSEKVLPKILVSFTAEGKETVSDYKVDDVTGEDQFAIFTAMMSLIEVSEDYFQIVSQ